ncbi:cytochrome c-type protein [Azoarcus olearius]|uniref:c-type cytochrome n=1 Tax=Azoarcus sp. (strain BH72) TaxID=418699 RepID=UPI00080614FB|nr:cytochrome c [Azoarcus olearius]ANQ84601.1 cytochrome c-type protein [Azoarcus olearius]
MIARIRLPSSAALFVFGALVAVAPPAQAGDAARGKEISTTCAACHGADGNSTTAEFPRIAGQHEDYLRQALTDYKAGKRRNPIMAAQVESLDKRDIADLSAWFASQKGLYFKR